MHGLPIYIPTSNLVAVLNLMKHSLSPYREGGWTVDNWYIMLLTAMNAYMRFMSSQKIIQPSSNQEDKWAELSDSSLAINIS
jgi:hypothetical protein